MNTRKSGQYSRLTWLSRRAALGALLFVAGPSLIAILLVCFVLVKCLLVWAAN